MIVFFTKEKSSFTEGQMMPLIELPVGQGGEKVELNDFQWWAPTDKWDAWLKAHPRDWKAESEDPEFDESVEELFESLVNDGTIDPYLVSFDEFYSLMEEEKAAEGGEISDEEASKRFTKFVFAYNKLVKEKKIELSISFDKLQVNSEYALILDLVGEGNQDIEQSRNAYKFKPINSSGKFIVGEINETLLTGPIPEGSSLGDTLIKVGKIVGRVALVGGLSIAGIALGVKALGSLSTRVGFFKILKKFIPGMKTAGKIGKNSWYFVKTLGGVVPFLKSAIPALKGAKTLATVTAAFKGAASAVGAARVAAGAAKATNPVGWIITAAMSAQQLYNWASDKQAPRLGEIEDEGIGAQNSFSPGTIPDGSAITICWTQEAGQGSVLASLGNILVTNDTRTTMSLIKIGNFNDKALFYLVNIHSEMYDKILKENPSIFLSFSTSKTFNGAGASLKSLIDNDDIEMEMIIPPGGKDAGAGGFFHGYCAWSEISEAFKNADDKMLTVPENAPEEKNTKFILTIKRKSQH